MLGAASIRNGILVAILVLGVTISASANDRRGDEVVFRLSDERLQCLRKHAAVYRAVKGDRLFIALAECPKLRARPGLSLLVNQGRSENRTNASAGRILYVTKAQFECLIRSRVARAPTYRFFPDTCRLERAE